VRRVAGDAHELATPDGAVRGAERHDDRLDERRLLALVVAEQRHEERVGRLAPERGQGERDEPADVLDLTSFATFVTLGTSANDDV
jgi:hypothetical protein